MKRSGSAGLRSRACSRASTSALVRPIFRLISASAVPRRSRAGPNGGLQDGAHFRFRAAAVLRRPDFQGAMGLVGEVANGDGGHDGVFTSNDSVAINIRNMIFIRKGSALGVFTGDGMGLVKNEWIEAQERGWSAPDTHVCADCVEDFYLKDLICDTACASTCDYCGRQAAQLIAAEAGVVMEAVYGAVNTYYAEPSGAGVPYEGGFIVEPIDIDEVLGNLGFDGASRLHTSRC